MNRQEKQAQWQETYERRRELARQLKAKGLEGVYYSRGEFHLDEEDAGKVLALIGVAREVQLAEE